MRTGAVFLWIIVRLASAMDKKEFLDLTTPVKSLGEGCGYERCAPIRADALNVHVVPHTHMELGYDKVFEDHFTGENEFKFRTSPVSMKRILDAIVTELWEHEHRTFTFSNLPFFFHWWSKRDPTVHRMVYTLIRQGRFNFAGGGWSITDEATTNYQMLIDTFTYGLRKLNATFTKCGRPLVAWQAHAAGHSKEFASLIALMGYDALFLSPISFDDELNRMGNASLEFIWRGNDDLGIETDIFTHSLFDGFESPPGFCFSSLCSDALVIVSDQTFSNVAERVSSFLTATVHRQSPYYRAQHIMVMMGGSRMYHDAQMWFRNIERLIEFTNSQAAEKSLAVRTFFSSPACYLKAVHASNPILPTKQDDFLPLRANSASFATGLYTSRPTIKYMIAEANRYMQIAKQLQILGRLGNNDKTFEELNWILGVMQDHNIITGASSQYVTDRYNHKLYLAVQRTTLVLKDGINSIRGSANTIIYYRCDFNVSSCHNAYIQSFYIIVYNPLAWPVTIPVRLPVKAGQKLIVTDPKGNKIPSYLMKIPDPVQDIPGRYRAATEEVVFLAEKLPPLGFRSYFFDSERIKVKTKRSIVENPKDEVEDGNFDLESFYRNLREGIGINNENKDSVNKTQDVISTTETRHAKEQEKEVVNNNLGEDHTNKQFLIYYPDDIESTITNMERNKKTIDKHQNGNFLIYYPDDIERTTTNMERNNKSIDQYQKTEIFYLDQKDPNHISFTENNHKNYNFGENLGSKNDSSYEKVNFKIQTAKRDAKDESQYNKDKNNDQVTIKKQSIFSELREKYEEEKVRNIQIQTEIYNQQKKKPKEYNENETNIFRHKIKQIETKNRKSYNKPGDKELNKNIIQTNIIQNYNNKKHETDLKNKKNRANKDRRQVNTEYNIKNCKTSTQVLNQSETIVKNNCIENHAHRKDMIFWESTTLRYHENMVTGAGNPKMSTIINFASLSEQKITKNDRSYTKKIRTEYDNQLLNKNKTKDDQTKIIQFEKTFNKANKNLYYTQTNKPLYKSHLNTQNKKENSYKIINSPNRPIEEENYYGINVTINNDIYAAKRSQLNENKLIDSSYEVTDRNAMRRTDTDTEEITFFLEATKQESFSKNPQIGTKKHSMSNRQETVLQSDITQNILSKYNTNLEKKQPLNKNNQNDDQYKSQDIENIFKINKEQIAKAKNENGVKEKSTNSRTQVNRKSTKISHSDTAQNKTTNKRKLRENHITAKKSKKYTKQQQKLKRKEINENAFCETLKQQAKLSEQQKENFEYAYIYDTLCSKSTESLEEFMATNENQQIEELIDNNTKNYQNNSQQIEITEENKDNEEELCNVLRKQNYKTGPEKVNSRYANIYNSLCQTNTNNRDKSMANNDKIRTNETNDSVIQSNLILEQIAESNKTSVIDDNKKRYKNLKQVYENLNEYLHTEITKENKAKKEELCDVIRKQNKPGPEKENSRYANIYDRLCQKNTDNQDKSLTQNYTIKTNETNDIVVQSNRTFKESNINSNNKNQEEYQDEDLENILNEYLNEVYSSIGEKSKKDEEKNKNNEKPVKVKQTTEQNERKKQKPTKQKNTDNRNKSMAQHDLVKTKETNDSVVQLNRIFNKSNINSNIINQEDHQDKVLENILKKYSNKLYSPIGDKNEKNEKSVEVKQTKKIKLKPTNESNEINNSQINNKSNINETYNTKSNETDKSTSNETNINKSIVTENIKINGTDLSKVNKPEAIKTDKMYSTEKNYVTDITTTEQPNFEGNVFPSTENINYKFKNVEEEIQWYKNLLRDPDLKYDAREYERRKFYLKQRLKDYKKPSVKISPYQEKIPNRSMFETPYNVDDKHVDKPSSDTRLKQNKKYKLTTNINNLNRNKLMAASDTEPYRNKDIDQSNLDNCSKPQSNISEYHTIFKRGDAWVDDPYLRKLAHLPTRRPQAVNLDTSDEDDESDTEKPKWDPTMVPGYYLREEKKRKGIPVRTTTTEKPIRQHPTTTTTKKPRQPTTTRKKIKYSHRKGHLEPLRTTPSPLAYKPPKRLPPVIMHRPKPTRKPKQVVAHTHYSGKIIKPARITQKEIFTDTDEETPGDNDNTFFRSDNDEAIVTTTEKKVNIKKSETKTKKKPPSERRMMVKTDFKQSSQTYIENQYLRLTIDPRSREVTHMNLSNGIQMSLNIQFLFYEADDPHNTGRDGVRPPGAHIFRALLNEPKRVMDKFTSRVYTNPIVQELHMTFSDWASVALRVYNSSPVVEVDWVVGPVPLTADIGREVFIRYKTSLVNNGVFYTDANGRQMMKRIRNKRPTFDLDDADSLAGNIYPVTSKISIRDGHKNMRFAVFNDRSQGGTSLNDGEIDLFVHRRILTVDDDVGGAVLNETHDDEPIRVRGTHYLYLTKANYKPNKLFEKKFAKEIALQPQVLVSGRVPGNRNLWQSFNNEFRGIRNKIPFGVHILTLERVGPGKLLIRLENYLQKSEMISAKPKRVYLKKLLTNILITSIRETTLAANQYLNEAWTPLQWKRESQFLANFNSFYGTGEAEYNDEEELRPLDDDNEMLKEGIWLQPQQIRSFIAQYEYDTGE